MSGVAKMCVYITQEAATGFMLLWTSLSNYDALYNGPHPVTRFCFTSPLGRQWPEYSAPTVP